MVNTGGVNPLLTTGNGGTHRPAPAPGEVENGGLLAARTSIHGGTAAPPTAPPKVIPAVAASGTINHTAAARGPNTTTYIPVTTTAAATRAFFGIKQPTNGNGT